MTINREMFLKEYRIAKTNNNFAFMEWLSDIMWKADETDVAKQNKIAEINYLVGDVSIPQEILLNAKNEILGGLM